MEKEKSIWQKDIGLRGHLAAVALPVLVLVVAALLLAGCVGRLQGQVEGAVCKPSESSLCSPEPLLTPLS